MVFTELKSLNGLRECI